MSGDEASHEGLALGMLLEGAGACAVLHLDAEGRVLRSLGGHERTLGLGQDALRGLALEELAVGDAERAALRESLARGGSGQREPVACVLRRADGRGFDARVALRPLASGGSLALVHDRTELRWREDAVRTLRDTTSFLDSIIEGLPQVIFVKEAEGLRYVRTNRAFEAFLGRDRGEIQGKSDLELFPEEQASAFRSADRAVLASGAVLDIPEEEVATPEGHRWMHTKKIPLFDEDGEPRFLLGISEDVTEKRLLTERLRQARDDLERRVQQRTADLLGAKEELERQSRERQAAQEALRAREEQLRHSQKMEAVGRLAGGIAHDFNNLLTVILSYAQLLSASMGPSDRARQDLAEIRRAARRAAELTRQLLAFSRRQVLAPRVVDLNEVLQGTQNMLRRLITEQVELRTHLAPRLASVRVDPSQVEQLLVNLVVNARDAMPEGGVVTIATAEREVAEGDAGVPPGSYVVLTVTDTGVGMDAETQARIWEPFFTTKGPGRGTGLGLAVVFGIVTQSEGHVRVHSAVGEGTTFTVYLPRVAGEPVALGTSENLAATSSLPRGTETILLVEDEDMVRLLASTVLSRSGYFVLTAANGEEALLEARNYSGPIHLLLTDLVMPRMGGRELAERLVEQRPDTRVLYMSGYTEDTVLLAAVGEASASLLQKPLTPELLLRSVRAALDR